MPGYQALNIPFSHATAHLTVFGIANIPSIAPASAFLQPVLPGRDNLLPASYSFLISNGNKKVLFDLGPRKDLENLSPISRGYTEIIKWNITKDITDRLHDAETPLDAINAVIFSHVHFDHVGDMSKFPSSTDLYIGPGTVRDIYSPDTNPNGTLLASDFANRTVTELSFDKTNTKIGGFKALDYFKDGSFYLLDVPGHMPGHLAAVVRVKPTTFVFLAADSFHHAAQVRPTNPLQKSVPIPLEVLESAQKNIDTTYFRSGGNDSATFFDLHARSGPFFDVPETGFYSDPATARISQRGVQAFDSNDDVFVLATHDSTVYPFVEEEGGTIFNEWKERGLKEKATWLFLNKSEVSGAWRLSASA
ncbi:beta-lactamase-like protein [Flagelloscypha sp. PMI_526]|nr:beta-lactamase-like protein [Flagelloscypha sp. PMI_526]